MGLGLRELFAFLPYREESRRTTGQMTTGRLQVRSLPGGQSGGDSLPPPLTPPHTMLDSVLTGLTIVVALLIPMLGGWSKITAQLTRIETIGGRVSEELDRHRSEDRENFNEIHRDVAHLSERLAAIEGARRQHP